MKHLVLLHGAIGAASQLAPISKILSKHFHCHLFNFSGHGSEPIKENRFSIQQFSNELNAFIERKQLNNVYVFGYSMGGYVALYSAALGNNTIAGIYTLATKFNWDVESAKREAAMLNPEMLKVKLPEFAKTLEQRHHPVDWKIVLEETASMMQAMGEVPPLNNELFAKISIPVRLTIGDADKMVSVEETQLVHSKIKGSTFKIFSNTKHPIEQVDVKQVAEDVCSFF